MIDFLRKKLFSDVVQLLLPFGYVTGTVLIYVFFLRFTVTSLLGLFNIYVDNFEDYYKILPAGIRNLMGKKVNVFKYVFFVLNSIYLVAVFAFYKQFINSFINIIAYGVAIGCYFLIIVMIIRIFRNALFGSIKVKKGGKVR